MNRKLWPLFVLLLASLSIACGGGPGGGPQADGAGSETAVDNAAEPAAAESAEPELASELSVYNWADYIDEELLAKYEAEYGVKIIYDTFASNEDLLAKLQAGAAGYDVIVPSDYMVAQMIELGLLAEIDTAKIPNFVNVGDEFRSAPFDPGNQHCVPYQWGTSGIAYSVNNEFFAENPPNSWAFIFDPAMLENYADQGVNVLNDPRELMAAALVYLGYEGNSQNPDEIAQARDLILQAKPYYKTFNSEDYDDTLLIAGEVVISHSWSGDAANAYWNTYNEETETSEWAYIIPQEGAVKWMDNLCITASSQRYDTAVHFINYLLDAENGGAITNFTFYASPNEAAKAYIDPNILGDTGIYPEAAVLAKLYWLTDVGDSVFLYDQAWTAIKGQ